ncbi:MAG: glycogen/starch/alpha-glucan phosphorylase [Sterolibacteriaceae bacterium]|uniref:Alpha-1,4 glucan phosphorylase n=1 Tax=Candidatus Methylophosphatis roskildensis TaxID=2899263 RepID=A0A9D7E8Y4_9PROT|nr:glycogen/starch/alpha-glucan phosphorylase [Candidatus Methylophosphatis roskildensis]
MATKARSQSISDPLLTELPPLGMDAKSLAGDISSHFNHTLGCDVHSKYSYHRYQAVAMALRDRLVDRWKHTHYSYRMHDCKRAYYLSLEFLMGRTLGNAVLNLDIPEQTRQALGQLGMKMEDIEDNEADAGLGNGGLGRLAACFLDSCATLQLPVMGHGIRYEYGIFRQRIANGEQMEEPDHWLIRGNPWELERPEFTQRVHFGGRTVHDRDAEGNDRVRWLDTEDVLAVPYDTPIPGYRNGTVNTLRLWKATATDAFDLGQFNAGSYTESVAGKNAAENITMVLYPNDASENGRQLRLRQQYFLASAALKDVLRRWRNNHGDDLSQFCEKNCFQLNDTHPSVAVAELMRLLMDEHGLAPLKAWEITTRCMAYTNHTLLPEALERWPVRLFQHLLPRILEIIYEINARFLVEVGRHWPGDMERLRRMSIFEEGDEQQVRMAYLAVVGSSSVNGVAALHTKLLQEGLFRDFYELWPDKFNNKTNGVTQRRWLALCNPDLSKLITETIGGGWMTDLEQLQALAPYADNAEFRKRWRAIKHANKARFADMLERDCGVRFDPLAMVDSQVKRIHEYKRQLLNVLHVIHLYDRLKRGDAKEWAPRCVVFGGKAAPGYWMAKRIIKLINNVANVVNNDPDIADRLKVAFLPNYRVSAMEVIAPGTDLSEQISTAGKEASGTGNMKFMMNGAITIGTYDGANIEILEAVGEDNFFLFGLRAEDVAGRLAAYNPNEIIEADDDLRRVMQMLESGHFSQFEPGIFEPISGSIRSPHDCWLTAADFRAYVDAQRLVSAAYLDTEGWTRMSILNTARSGWFSTDRTMREYNRDIWKLDPIAALPSG